MWIQLKHPAPLGRLGYPSPAELCKSHDSSRGNLAQTLLKSCPCSVLQNGPGHAENLKPHASSLELLRGSAARRECWSGRCR